MGYDSTFSGSLKPSKKIPHELVKRINEAALDIRVAGEHEDYEPGTLVPWTATMHGYNIVTDVVKVQRLLEKDGILLSGDIWRSGEDGDDFEKIEVRRGKVYSRTGEVTYGKRRRYDVQSVTRYAVRKFVSGRFVAWISPPNLITKKYDTVKPARCGGKPVMDRPPPNAGWFDSRADADKHRMNVTRRSRSSKTRYDVVSWEEKI